MYKKKTINLAICVSDPFGCAIPDTYNQIYNAFSKKIRKQYGDDVVVEGCDALKKVDIQYRDLIFNYESMEYAIIRNIRRAFKFEPYYLICIGFGIMQSSNLRCVGATAYSPFIQLNEDIEDIGHPILKKISDGLDMVPYIDFILQTFLKNLYSFNKKFLLENVGGDSITEKDAKEIVKGITRFPPMLMKEAKGKVKGIDLIKDYKDKVENHLKTHGEMNLSVHFTKSSLTSDNYVKRKVNFFKELIDKNLKFTDHRKEGKEITGFYPQYMKSGRMSGEIAAEDFIGLFPKLENYEELVKKYSDNLEN